ncbi:MAG TPA: hypothetical protein VNX26_15530 [Candidatus Acidoferrum sp.]|nr:hypothetical protein [Candidatus Acidoferrum sp.]
MAGQFDYPHFYSNLASLCDNVSIRLDSAEARIQELVEQLANEPDSNKIALLARELNVLLQRNARRDAANKETPKEMWVGYHRFIAVMGPIGGGGSIGLQPVCCFLCPRCSYSETTGAAFPVFAVAWVLGAIGN